MFDTISVPDVREYLRNTLTERMDEKRRVCQDETCTVLVPQASPWDIAKQACHRAQGRMLSVTGSDIENLAHEQMEKKSISEAWIGAHIVFEDLHKSPGRRPSRRARRDEERKGTDQCSLKHPS